MFLKAFKASLRPGPGREGLGGPSVDEFKFQNSDCKDGHIIFLYKFFHPQFLKHE